MKKGCLSYIIIIISIIVVLFGIFVMWPKILIDLNKEKMAESYRKGAEEAKKFAVSSTSEGCVQEALSKVASFPSSVSLKQRFIIAEQQRGFIEECLKLAEYTPGFCDNIPKMNTTQELSWESRKCKDSSNNPECLQVWGEVVGFCSSRNK